MFVRVDLARPRSEARVLAPQPSLTRTVTKKGKKMRQKKIKKRKGNRWVVCPSASQKAILKRIAKKLHPICEQVDVYNVAHGFRRGRNIVTNASAHIGYQWSVCVDIKDFFDHVTANSYMIKEIAENYPLILFRGRAAQGLPTSPLLANIAAAPMDNLIVRSLPAGCVYTRYADDMTVSGNDRAHIPAVLTLLRESAKAHGWELSRSKTRIQDARYGRRIITGVAVDQDGIYPTKAARRKLRAAIHSCKPNNVVRGLQEYVLLKPPTDEIGRQLKKRIRRIAYICRKKSNIDPVDVMVRVAAIISKTT